MRRREENRRRMNLKMKWWIRKKAKRMIVTGNSCSNKSTMNFL
jgi:hypothetical protein